MSRSPSQTPYLSVAQRALLEMTGRGAVYVLVEDSKIRMTGSAEANVPAPTPLSVRLALEARLVVVGTEPIAERKAGRWYRLEVTPDGVNALAVSKAQAEAKRQLRRSGGRRP